MGAAKSIETETRRRGMSYPRYFLLLAAFCLVGVLSATVTLLANGQGPIYELDGLSQTLNKLIYEGELMRSTIATFFSGGGFELPQYTFDPGYGASIISSVRRFDPITKLAVFVPARFGEYLYYVTLFLRVYLCAVFFSLYCFGRKQSKAASFVASLCYAFCGFAVFWCILRHPHLLTGAYQFPLMLYGADRLFKGKSPIVFVIAVAFAFMTSAYFAYMQLMALVVYCIAEYFLGDRRRSPRDLIVLVLKFVGSGLLAAVIAAVSLLPSVFSLFSMERVTDASKKLVISFSDPSYYNKFVSSLIGGSVNDANARYLGAVAVVLLIILICCGKKFPKYERRPLLVCIAVSFVAALIPYLSHVLNGFNYVTDRWMFILAFFTSYGVCLTVPVLRSLKASDWLKAGAGCLVVLALVFLPLKNHTEQVIACAMLFAATFGVVVLLGAKLKNRRAISAVLASIVVLSVAVPCYYVLDEEHGQGYGSEMLNHFGSAYKTYTSKSPFLVMDSMPEDLQSQYRYSMVSTYGGQYRMNSLLRPRQGLDSYYSHYTQSIDTFRREVGLSDRFFCNVYYGSDGRLALDAFSAAKYFVASKSHAWLVPATYANTGMTENEKTAYETDVALPLAFCYTDAISRKSYEALDMAGKQEAILEGCVISDKAIDELGVDPIEPTVSSFVVDADVALSDGIRIEGDELIVEKKDATITFTFDPVSDAETYACFDNIMLKSPSAKTFDVTVKCANGERTVTPITPFDSRRYSKKDSWIVNLGYSSEGIGSVEVSFARKGTYSYGEIYVECQPIDPIVAHLEELQKHALSGIAIGGNSISGNARTSEDLEFALFTYGYDAGWSATVDGQAVKPVRADTGFVAVPVVGAGTHEIVLTYEIPGTLFSTAVSVAGIVVLVAIGVVGSRRRKRHLS